MNSRIWLIIAGIIAGLISICLLAIAVPQNLWTNDSIASTIILFLSLASPALLPAPIPKNTTGDTHSIWLIVPLSQLFIVLLVTASLAIRFSLIGWHTASWMTCVLWLGVYVIGYAILQATSNVVAIAASQTQISKEDARSQWLGKLRKLQILANEDVRPSIQRISDAVQFAANDRAGHEASENADISAIFEIIESNIDKPDELDRLIRSIEVLLAQREHSLKAARTYA
jgi:predicted membrane protein